MATVSLDDLAVFVAVAESGSFSTAAARLGLPKSSVSRAIARLEAAMGVALVHRTTRHVALSTAGTALLERSAPQIASLRQCVGALPELEEEPSGLLRLTAANDFGATVLGEIVARFVIRYPSVEVDVRLTNQVLDLVAESIDLAVRNSTRRLKDSTLTARKVGPVTLQLFAAPSYLSRRGSPRLPRDLGEHAWVRMRPITELRLEGPAGENVTVRPAGPIVGDDMGFILNAVREGGGIGVLPVFLADAGVVAGELVRVLPRWNIHSGDIWLVSPAGRRQPRKVTAFVEFFIEALKSRALIPRDADFG
jgi:DNA-binding transcriptional LysR family regulator